MAPDGITPSWKPRLRWCGSGDTPASCHRIRISCRWPLPGRTLRRGMFRSTSPTRSPSRRYVPAREAAADTAVSKLEGSPARRSAGDAHAAMSEPRSNLVSRQITRSASASMAVRRTCSAPRRALTRQSMRRSRSPGRNSRMSSSSDPSPGRRVRCSPTCPAARAGNSAAGTGRTAGSTRTGAGFAHTGSAASSASGATTRIPARPSSWTPASLASRGRVSRCDAGCAARTTSRPDCGPMPSGSCTATDCAPSRPPASSTSSQLPPCSATGGASTPSQGSAGREGRTAQPAAVPTASGSAATARAGRPAARARPQSTTSSRQARCRVHVGRQPAGGRTVTITTGTAQPAARRRSRAASPRPPHP